MPRIDGDDLRDPELIYVAATLRAARGAEEWLTRAGVDYAVQVEEIGRTLLFRRMRMGAAFYVAAAAAQYCRQQLASAGFGKGIVEPEP